MKHIKLSLSKFTFLFILTNFSVNIISQTIQCENDPNISRDTRVFLKALNSESGVPLEALSPKDARQVLVDAQNSFSYDYSDVEECLT